MLKYNSCYRCGVDTLHPLSPRSRCITCEYNNAMFNDNENSLLREREATLEEQLRVLCDVLEELVECEEQESE